MNTKKETRGRRKIPANEKKVPVNIYVPKKHKKKAQAECDIVEAKYTT